MIIGLDGETLKVQSWDKAVLQLANTTYEGLLTTGNQDAALTLIATSLEPVPRTFFLESSQPRPALSSSTSAC